MRLQGGEMVEDERGDREVSVDEVSIRPTRNGGSEVEANVEKAMRSCSVGVIPSSSVVGVVLRETVGRTRTTRAFDGL